MTVNFWRSRNADERRQKLIDYAIIWAMIMLMVAGVGPRLIASWSALFSAS